MSPKLLSEYDQSAVKLAGQALGEIVTFQNNRKSIAPSTGRLFHYTTADGLKRIIEKNELWAISAYSLNDFSDFIYGCGVLKEVWMNGLRRAHFLRIR